MVVVQTRKSPLKLHTLLAQCLCLRCGSAHQLSAPPLSIFLFLNVLIPSIKDLTVNPNLFHSTRLMWNSSCPVSRSTVVQFPEPAPFFYELLEWNSECASH